MEKNIIEKLLENEERREKILKEFPSVIEYIIQ